MATATLYSRGNPPREPGSRPIRPRHGGAMCLDYVNTASDHSGHAAEDDLAPGYVNLVSWCAQSGVLDDDDARRLLRAAAKDPREAAAVRKRAAALRTALYEVVRALMNGASPAPEALDTFNREHHHALAFGDFVAEGPRLAWRWQDGPSLDRMLWPICHSAAQLLGGDDGASVRQCAAPACQNLFLDASKNGSRRYCSPATCGTADRVRRFRERRKSSQIPPER